MEKKQLPTQAQIKEVLHYDPESGVFRWRFAVSNSVKPWSVAGSKDTCGYLQIKTIQAHRLAIFYVTGNWPINDVDHIDGNRLNNAFKNLRPVTRKQNAENRAINSNNSSGYRGVSWHKNRKSWAARVVHNMKHIHIGWFKTSDEAAVAVKKAREVLFTHDERRDQITNF